MVRTGSSCILQLAKVPLPALLATQRGGEDLGEFSLLLETCLMAVGSSNLEAGSFGFLLPFYSCFIDNVGGDDLC
jgi:hypothetical protein